MFRSLHFSVGSVVLKIKMISFSRLSRCRFIFLNDKQRAQSCWSSGYMALVGSAWGPLLPLLSRRPQVFSPPWCPLHKHMNASNTLCPLGLPMVNALFTLMASISPSTETSNLPPVFPDQAQMSPSSWFPSLPRATLTVPPRCSGITTHIPLWERFIYSLESLGLHRPLCEPSEVRSSSFTHSPAPRSGHRVIENIWGHPHYHCSWNVC